MAKTGCAPAKKATQQKKGATIFNAPHPSRGTAEFVHVRGYYRFQICALSLTLLIVFFSGTGPLPPYSPPPTPPPPATGWFLAQQTLTRSSGVGINCDTVCSAAGLICDREYGRQLIHGDLNEPARYSYAMFLDILNLANSNYPEDEQATTTCPSSTFGMPSSQSYLPAIKYNVDGTEQCKMVKSDSGTCF